MILRYPPLVVCEWGARQRLPAILAEVARRERPPYALVTGPSPRSQAWAAEFAAVLGAPVAHFTAIAPEPDLAPVDQLLAVLRQHRPAVVVAAGGGSVIDVAKAAAGIAPADGTAADYFHGRRQLARPGLPLVALPTTAGSGAEITKNAVLTDAATASKQSIRHDVLIPAAAVCDAELTVTLPPAATAASGLDALTQAIESYLSPAASPATQALARQAVSLLLAHLPAACRDGRDRAARSGLMLGSVLSALSFSQAGLGAVHGLAHPLGARLKLPHGYVCAVLLPHVLRYNAPACGPALAELAAATGAPDADAFIAGIARLAADLGIPHGLNRDGLTPAAFDFVVANCRSNSMKTNPRPMPDAAVRELLTALAGA